MFFSNDVGRLFETLALHKVRFLGKRFEEILVGGCRKLELDFQITSSRILVEQDHVHVLVVGRHDPGFPDFVQPEVVLFDRTEVSLPCRRNQNVE